MDLWIRRDTTIAGVCHLPLDSLLQSAYCKPLLAARAKSTGAIPNRMAREPVDLESDKAADSANSARFVVGGKKFSQQFSHVYFFRLNALRSSVRQRALRHHSAEFSMVDRILDLKEGVPSIVIGTLYKEMQLKPDILQQTHNEDRQTFVSNSDFLILEDESGRIRIRSPLDGTTSAADQAQKLHPCRLLTGLIVAVCGQVNHAGEFAMEDVCFAGLPGQHPRPLPGPATSGSVLLVSELLESDYKTQLLIDYVASHTEVRHVICAGNCMASPDLLSTERRAGGVPGGGSGGWEGSGLRYSTASRFSDALKLPGDFHLAELASYVSVDCMPGPADPAGFSLPQQPLYKAVIPAASMFSSLRPCTNPHALCLHGVEFLGSSGQNIESICKYMNADGWTEALENCLHWRHMAPTAPDTLPCYAFFDDDPFIISSCPHVFFAGNAPRFETKLLDHHLQQQVRLVAVPSFWETGIAALVDLSTLEVRPIAISSV